jgi:hypothetical protein
MASCVFLDCVVESTSPRHILQVLGWLGLCGFARLRLTLLSCLFASVYTSCVCTRRALATFAHHEVFHRINHVAPFAKLFRNHTPSNVVFTLVRVGEVASCIMVRTRADHPVGVVKNNSEDGQ